MKRIISKFYNYSIEAQIMLGVESKLIFRCCCQLSCKSVHTLTILLRKKYFASLKMKCLPMSTHSQVTANASFHQSCCHVIILMPIVYLHKLASMTFILKFIGQNVNANVSCHPSCNEVIMLILIEFH